MVGLRDEWKNRETDELLKSCTMIVGQRSTPLNNQRVAPSLGLIPRGFGRSTAKPIKHAWAARKGLCDAAATLLEYFRCRDQALEQTSTIVSYVPKMA